MSIAAEAFAKLAKEEFGLMSEYDPILAAWLRIMREQEPAICGMAFHVPKGVRAREDYTCHYWDARVHDELAGWLQVYARDEAYSQARFFLWRDGEIWEIDHRANFFAKLHALLREE